MDSGRGRQQAAALHISAVNDRSYSASPPVLPISPGARNPSNARYGIFFPGIGVVPFRESWFFGLPCKQIILDIAPVFLPDYGTDNLH